VRRSESMMSARSSTGKAPASSIISLEPCMILLPAACKQVSRALFAADHA
jgi:hypothetical protein